MSSRRRWNWNGYKQNKADKKNRRNVSAGTSVFAMIVLEKELKKVYDEIDLVTTPSGDLVGMVHCNNPYIRFECMGQLI